MSQVQGRSTRKGREGGPEQQIRAGKVGREDEPEQQIRAGAEQ